MKLNYDEILMTILLVLSHGKLILFDKNIEIL